MGDCWESEATFQNLPTLRSVTIGSTLSQKAPHCGVRQLPNTFFFLAECKAYILGLNPPQAVIFSWFSMLSIFINVSTSTWKNHDWSIKVYFLEWVTLTKNLKIMFRHVLRLKQSTNRRFVISFSHLPVSKCTIKWQLLLFLYVCVECSFLFFSEPEGRNVHTTKHGLL